MKKLSIDYIDLKDYILKDFKDVVDDIENDYEMGIDLNTECYIFVDGIVIGYMCFFNFPDFGYASYTKIYDRSAQKYMYKTFKDKYLILKEDNKPLLIDNNSSYGYCNHIIPHKLSGLFQVIL